MSAFCAFLREDIFAVFYFNRDRFHQAATIGSSISGVDIYMLAPQAIRAVVGITVAMDMCAAMFAGKIFNLAVKFFHFYSRYRYCIIISIFVQSKYFFSQKKCTFAL